jgi:hypothetical protein
MGDKMSIYKIAARAASDVYRFSIDLGTTEINYKFVTFRGCRLQVLAFSGTNEAADWLKNLALWSKKGIKKGSHDAAMEANEIFPRIPSVPLLVTGHSKGGADAIAYNKLFGATWCVAFCPARSLRYWTDRTMHNTSIFIDPNDPVPALGCLSFGHPVCHVEHLHDDNFGWHIKDHFMANIVRWLDERAD